MPRYYPGPASDHFDGKRFFNPGVANLRGAFALLRWKLTAHPKPWPKTLPLLMTDAPPPAVAGNGLRASYVGHATVLLQTAGLNIVTDPVWSDHASPLAFTGPKRAQKPGIDFARLPKIHVVALSHNHYDHLDIPTLRFLATRDDPLIITPLGNDAIIRRHIPAARIETLDWRQSCEYRGVAFHCLPAQHWSSRTPFDRDRALWGAFAITTPGGNIYFAADSGYHTHFREAFENFGAFRFAMLPIGAYEPRWFMRHHHMNPADAVQAFEDLGRPMTLAIHHDVFRLADEGFGDATRDLAAALRAKNMPGERFIAPPPGTFMDIG